jgi:hypothetical protein
MKCLVRFLFAASAFLILGTSAHAQRIIFYVSAPAHSSSFHHRGTDWGWESPSSSFYSSHRRQSVCATNEYIIGYAHGEPDFIPSTYMDYDKALELGRRMLEEQSKPEPEPIPLGDVARSLRSNSGLSALDRSPMSVLQDNRGRLVICGVDVTSC